MFLVAVSTVCDVKLDSIPCRIHVKLLTHCVTISGNFNDHTDTTAHSVNYYNYSLIRRNYTTKQTPASNRHKVSD